MLLIFRSLLLLAFAAHILAWIPPGGRYQTRLHRYTSILEIIKSRRQNECILRRIFPPLNGAQRQDVNNFVKAAQGDFLQQVETSVANVLHQYRDHNMDEKDFVLTLQKENRESYSVARLVQKRLESFHRNDDCPRCWLQQAHCICDECPPLQLPKLSSQSNAPTNSDTIANTNIRRIFLVMHHKEICLAVDTAKLILACFPDHCRLVVAGIDAEHQASLQEMNEVMCTSPQNCLVLFPTDEAQTYSEILLQQPQLLESKSPDSSSAGPWDLIVMDGTWNQARKMHSRYIPLRRSSLQSPRRVQLSATSLEELAANTDSSSSSSGRQLRRHPIDWRAISTCEATRLLLLDMDRAHAGESPGVDSSINGQHGAFWEKMRDYQAIANRAAQKQLGPPRAKKTPM